MKKTFLKIFSLISFLSLYPFSFSIAETKGGLVTCINNCTFCDIILTSRNIINLMIELSFIFVVAAIVYGAFLMMTSGGNSQNFEKGKKAITTSLYGIVIVFVSWVLITEVLSILSGNGPIAPWSEISC